MRWLSSHQAVCFLAAQMIKANGLLVLAGHIIAVSAILTSCLFNIRYILPPFNTSDTPVHAVLFDCWIIWLLYYSIDIPTMAMRWWCWWSHGSCCLAVYCQQCLAIQWQWVGWLVTLFIPSMCLYCNELMGWWPLPVVQFYDTLCNFTIRCAILQCTV